MTSKWNAACLLAVAGTAAHAEGSQIYGSIDLGIATVTRVAGKGRLTAMQNGGMSNSRLGFKGSEDIGGGNAVRYLLESDVLADVGSSGNGPLFARSSWIGLAGAWGELRLGRNYTDSYELSAKYDPMSAGNFGGLLAVVDSARSALDAKSGNLFTSYGSTRVDNSIHYRSPAWRGFSARLTYGAGEVPGSAKTNSLATGAIEYAQGPVEGALVLGEMHSPSSPALVFRHKAFYARYATSIGRLVAGRTESIGLGPGGGSFVTEFIGANLPSGPAWIVNVFAGRVQNHVLHSRPATWSLRADYYLSKRSMLYGGYAASRQDHDSRLNIVNMAKFSSAAGAGNQPDAGDSQTGYMVGLRHVF